MNGSNNGNGTEPAYEEPIDLWAAAAFLHIGPKTVERLARKGLLPANKRGRSWQFLKSQLSEWLREDMKSNLDKHKPQNKDKQKENGP